MFDKDESPREDTTIEILRSLKPAFKKDGTVTAANAPGVNDGAAAVVVTSAKRARELGAQPMVHIVAEAISGIDPKWVMMAPVFACAAATRYPWPWKGSASDRTRLVGTQHRRMTMPVPHSLTLDAGGLFSSSTCRCRCRPCRRQRDREHRSPARSGIGLYVPS